MDKANEGLNLYTLKKGFYSSNQFKYACISILLFTVFLLIVSPPWRILNFDEVDYFTASRKGLWVNAFDSSSLGINDFLSLAFWKMKIISVPQQFNEYRESFDTFLLRHFHPPFLQYISSYFAFIPKEDFKTAEKLAFLVRWGLGCFFIISSFFLSATFFQIRYKNLYYLVKILFISYSAILLSLYLQYHLLIAILLQVTCYSFIKLLNNPIKRNFLLFSITLAFSIISLETSLFSIVIFSIIYFFNNKNYDSISKLISTIIIYFWLLPFLFSSILWPGALFKLSIFKSYGMYIYKLFFIKTEWSGVFDFERFSPILAVLLVYISLLALSVIFMIKKNSFNFGLKNPYKLFFIFGLSYSFCMLPFSLFHTYMIPGLFIATLPVLELLNHEIIQKKFFKLSQFIVVVCISIGCFQLNNMGFYEYFFSGFPGKNSLNNIAEIASEKDLDIYSDAGNILEFYIPKLSTKIKDIKLITKDNDNFDSKFKLFIRENQEYKEISFDSIKKPALFLFRAFHNDITNNLNYPCNSIEVKNLEGHACIVEN